MNDMNCEAYRERIIDVMEATANHPSRECEEVLAHLRDCDECKKLAGEMLESFSLVALSLPPAEIPVDFENRVLDKIAARDVAQDDDSARYATESVLLPSVHLEKEHASSDSLIWSRLLSYGLAAGLLIAVAGGQWLQLKRVETAAFASRDPSEEERVASLERAVAEMQELQQRAEQPEIRFVSFQPEVGMPIVGNKPKISAHAFWDSLAGQVHFFGFDMKPLGDGETYAIWFQVDDEYILATPFNATTNGLATVVADVSTKNEAAPMPKQLIVSVETTPLGEAPSDQVWLKAEFN